MEQIQRENADRCDTLAKITFVVGLLGSVAVAYFLGAGYYERNWGVTVISFLVSLFWTGVLYEVLEGISLIIEAQIKIMRALNDNGIVASKKEDVNENTADNSNVGIAIENAIEEATTSAGKAEENSIK